jgi:hypothetical protein
MPAGTAQSIQGLVIMQLSGEVDQDGGRIVRHARQIFFQLAEVAVSRELFVAIFERISRLSLASG